MSKKPKAEETLRDLLEQISSSAFENTSAFPRPVFDATDASIQSVQAVFSRFKRWESSRSSMSVSVARQVELGDGLVFLDGVFDVPGSVSGSSGLLGVRVTAMFRGGTSSSDLVHLHVSSIGESDADQPPAGEVSAEAEIARIKEQLIHQEKLASLGHLTAGIAHEIKNPLNFVTNFADLSVEIIDELRDALARGEDVDDLLADLEENVKQIAKHGGRADSIARSMMQHASGGISERMPADVNDLVDEFVGLAYHGMRARRPGFNVDLDVTFGPDVGDVEIVRGDIGRVILNLLGNAFDSLHERSQGEEGFRARVEVRTKREGRMIEIRVADNGMGIHEDVARRLFEPFVTTKAVGHGTGLGLSMSRQIVEDHGGELSIENVDEGARFVIRLPADR